MTSTDIHDLIRPVLRAYYSDDAIDAGRSVMTVANPWRSAHFYGDGRGGWTPLGSAETDAAPGDSAAYWLSHGTALVYGPGWERGDDTDHPRLVAVNAAVGGVAAEKRDGYDALYASALLLLLETDYATWRRQHTMPSIDG